MINLELVEEILKGKRIETYTEPKKTVEEMTNKELIEEHNKAGKSMETYKKYHGKDRMIYVKTYREIKKRGLTI